MNTWTNEWSRPGRSRWWPRKILVTELQHAVRLRDGKVTRALPPGRHWVRRRDQMWWESATSQVLIVPSQEVLTQDGVTVRATVATVVKVVAPIETIRSGEWRQQLHLDIQLALRTGVTSAALEDLIAHRSGLDEPILAAARVSGESMGIEVEKLALRDLVVPGDQRKLLAQVVEARLAGQASLERARGETAALRNLANAASMMQDNPELYRLRLLQEIAASTGNTFVVGVDGEARAIESG